MDIPPTDLNRVVYVVVGWPRRAVNERVARLMELRPHFRKMTLVVRGREPGNDEILTLQPIPNPFSLLRRASLTRVANTLERLVLFPNRHVLFTAVARRRLERLVRADLARGHEVSVVTCVPNHENTSIGLYLKHHFPGIHWVVDWQDLWSYDENYYERVPAPYRGLLRRREARVLAAADMNVTTNAHAARILRDVYRVPTRRVCAIAHPFDPSLVPNDEVRPPRGEGGRATITLGFLGSLFKPPRVPGAQLLEALRGLRAAGVDVALHLHGGVPAEVSRNEGILPDAGVIVERHLDPHEIVPVLRRYDYLLILLADLPNSRAVLSIKLPQYLLTGRPIIAVVPEHSAVADIVRRARAGVVVPSETDWAKGLGEVLKQNARSTYPPADASVIDEFAWDRLAPQWIKVLTACPG